MGRITLPLYTPLYQPTGEEVAVIETTKGTVRVKLDAAGAPVTVGNFIELSARGFYNELKFHACKPGSVVLGVVRPHVRSVRHRWRRRLVVSSGEYIQVRAMRAM